MTGDERPLCTCPDCQRARAVAAMALSPRERRAVVNPKLHPPGARYLGDGVYVTFDGYHIWLTTGSHERSAATHAIALEPEVVDALADYVKEMAAWLTAETAKAEEPT